MDLYSKKAALIKNSECETYSFYIVNQNTIKCDYFNDKGEYIKSLPVAKDNIQDFDVDIDEKDVIHLLCLTKEGNLSYYIYRDKRWSNYILTNLDVKSNKYRNLTLKVVRKKIHIFYSVSNLLNHNLWTIKHVTSGKRKWSKNNIIGITPGKSSDLFYISFDRTGGIHLIYTDIDKGKQHVYYTSYNTFLQRWNKSPEKISDDNTDNFSPFLFIDNMNCLHIAWHTMINNSHQLVYKQMVVLSNSKHSWKRYKLPLSSGNSSKPIIIQDNGMLKLLYNHDNCLKCCYSSNHGYSWSLDNSTNNISFQGVDLIKFTSNYAYDKFKMKVDYTYGSAKNNVQLYYCSSYKHSVNTNSIKNDSNSFYDLNNSNDTEIFLNESKQKKELPKNNTQLVDDPEDKHNPNKILEEDTVNVNNGNDYTEKDSLDYNTEPVNNKKELDNKIANNPIPEHIEKIKDEDVKEFVRNTKIRLDILNSNTNILKDRAEEVEDIILSNAKELDNKILSNKEFTIEVRDFLSTLEETLNKCKSDNEDISELLTSIEELYDSNTVQIKNIQNKIQKIYDIIENSVAPNLLKKILSIFR